MKWKIYYGDGTTFDSNIGSPNETPSLNVQVILCKDNINGRNIYHTWDWYYWNGETWRGADIHGLLDQLLNDKEGKITAVKQGRTIRDDIYENILKKAINDKDFKMNIENKLSKPERKGVDI